jgi:hypothetical protein
MMQINKLIQPSVGADLSALIGINLTQSSSTSVGARVVRSGFPTSSALAPTDHPASCLASRLSLMPIGRDPSAPPVHPSIHGQTPLKKETYLPGKNDVLLRTVPPQKSGYTSSEATHETSSEPCSHDTSSTGTLRRTPCMERSPICNPGRASNRPCWTSSFAGSKKERTDAKP